MGFPEAIARAQRDALRNRIQRTLDDTTETVEALRALAPHNMALTRGEYDRLLEYMVGAKTSLALGLDRIDESLARQVREQDAADLAAIEQEVEPKEE